MALARLRGNEILGLGFANIIGVLVILVLTTIILDNSSRYRLLSQSSQIDNLQPNLRGTKLKLINIKSEILSKKIENGFVLSEKQISKEMSPKTLRHLSTNHEALVLALYVDLATIFFICILMFSFCIEKKNEAVNTNHGGEVSVGCCICCVCCDDQNCNCDNCDCQCGSNGGNCGDAGAGILIILLLVLVFVLLYFAVKACGKNTARYVAITGEIFLNFVIAILVFLSGFNDILNIIVCLIAGILAISNLLTILLPNLDCFIHKYNLPTQNPPFIQNQGTSSEANQVTPSIAPSPVNEPAPIPVSNAPIDYKTSPIYSPQAPLSYPPNYPPQNPPYYSPPISNNGYNSGSGGIYNPPPS